MEYAKPPLNHLHMEFLVLPPCLREVLADSLNRTRCRFLPFGSGGNPEGPDSSCQPRSVSCSASLLSTCEGERERVCVVYLSLPGLSLLFVCHYWDQNRPHTHTQKHTHTSTHQHTRLQCVCHYPHKPKHYEGKCVRG